MPDIITFIDADPESRFTGLPLRVEHVDGPTWELVREVTYLTKAGELCTVRVGLHFDFASVPRPFWWLYPPQGTKGNPYGIASLIHDWLYIHHAIGGRAIKRKEADDLFYEIMIYLECRKTLAYIMWVAVRTFGWRGWDKKK